MNQLPKHLAALTIAAVLLLGAWLVAGPYLAIHGIRQAVEKQDVSKLERYIDFAALRANLRAQVEDRLAREIDQRLGRGVAGGNAATVAGVLSDNAVNAMVSPTGIAILLQGHALKQRIAGNTVPESGSAGQTIAYDPLKEAKTRFESPSRFIATVNSAKAQPVTFVFERKGLRWRLSDIVLPPLPNQGASQKTENKAR
ncbi:DUF2939 domain-containing protein [Lysobacter pythonis]|uniref:DUF2939 domain-containing protein n=1 Tax=Solilutibacter pythonis TaxID=2483112 RepID=A0A3M2I5X8_9GAMM|nr:DUF2939 domain-containing protein [Lysobacter pythonis]RMH94939.1 DUF2939 domain-containing protein [Lysobacter pythonis]